MTISHKGITKVVMGDQLERLTMEGWVVLDSFSEMDGTTIAESVPMVIPGQSYATSQYGNRAMQRSTQKFLVGKDEESSLADLTKQLIDLGSTQATLKQERQRAMDALDESIKTTASRDTTINILNNRLNHSIEDCKRLKAETDTTVIKLTKVRVAIGEIQYQQIVGVEDVK